MIDNMQKLLKFFHQCERLKTEKRHGKTSDNERDRVAGHSWRLAIMIMFIAPFLEKKIDVLKALKIALIHDLGEIVTGDQAYFYHMFDENAKKLKEEKEKIAIAQIIEHLPQDNQSELESLWLEYEEQSSYEAKVVKAIDKVEAQIQHNEADISVWNDYDRKYYDTYLDKFCNFDQALKVLKELTQDESEEKLKNS